MNDEPSRVARLLLESASTLAAASGARAIVVAADALPELETLPARTILVARGGLDEPIVRRLAPSAVAVIEVPPAQLDRMGQVRLAALIALAQGELERRDVAVFLTGPYRATMDTLVVMSFESEYELLDAGDDAADHRVADRAVFHRVLTIALRIGQFGREGRPVGALFVIGDHEAVLERSDQMILNPFRGYAIDERNVLDDRTTETLREFAALDGAIVIRDDGTIESAGTQLRIGRTADLPAGLGARHGAAAGITAGTAAIAITVSETDGTVRVWRAGRLAAGFEPATR